MIVSNKMIAVDKQTLASIKAVPMSRYSILVLQSCEYFTELISVHIN